MKVVASGRYYLDIDAYGGCIAYAELLNLLGYSATAVSTAPLNASIPPSVRAWQAPLARDYQARSADEYVVIDISEVAAFDTFVDASKVVEVIDHHMEFADYWHDKLGARAQIEFIGAACTLVAERWIQAGELEQISELSARLLIAGILDNTLNFKASIATNRDRKAYDLLWPLAKLSQDWPAQYFSECQQAITGDLAPAIQNDFKRLAFPSLVHSIGTGQLVLWDAESIIRESMEEVRTVMASQAEHWIMNIISIGEGCNYLLASDKSMQEFLAGLLGVTFSEGYAVTDRLYLRKELMKRDMDAKR